MHSNDYEAFQNDVARIALAASAPYDFLLAGGKALQAHGLSQRPTEDIDIFTNQNDLTAFDQAVASIQEALGKSGYEAEEYHRSPGFSRMRVTNPVSQDKVELDLGIDWRSDSAGTAMGIGGVISEDDAVATKMLALFGRSYTRDFIDFTNILDSGKYSLQALFDLAKEHDPGFDLYYFAQALLVIRRIQPEQAAEYGLSLEQWQTITERMVKIAEDIMREL